MDIQFMTWNTRLYMQGNRVGNKQEKIDFQKSEKILDVVKNHVDKHNGIAILQEIPYKINCKYENLNLNKWDKHPVYDILMEKFPKTGYDVFYDDSNKWRIIQTVIIAKKGLVKRTDKARSSNSFYSFIVDDLECLGIHSDDAFELRKWIKENHLYPNLIAGDFNAGNYLLKDEKKDREIAINRQNFLLLLEGYIDIFQGKITTNYKNAAEQRQIDHVLLENSCRISEKYEYKSIKVDTDVCLSDHYPLYWTLVKKQ